MAINHKDHDHPNTPAARAACRKAMAAGETPMSATDGVTPAEDAATWHVVPRRTKRAPKAPSGNLKRPGTRLRTIGDLPDVPRMLAYGARLAWAAGYEVKIGEQFNDTEARIVIAGDKAEIALVWKPSLPDGVWGIFVRNWNSSRTFKVTNVQEAFEVAATDGAWDLHGNLVGL